MDCAEFESRLADYLDGTLSAPDRAAVESHASACPNCREFMAEVSGAVALLGRLEGVEPPHDLVTRIAYQAPLGKSRSEYETPSFLTRLKIKWLEPLLQPRLAMGMAMTVLSFSMLAKCTGVPVQHIQASDLNPSHIVASVEDRVLRTRDRMLKNYENLRIVYEVEARLNDMEKQSASRERNKPSSANRGSDNNGGQTGSADQPQKGEQQ